MYKKFLLVVAAAFALTSAAWAAQPYPTTVSSIAAMQALGQASGLSISNVLVDSYHSGGSVGGGPFIWNPTSTAASDNCTIFQATGITTGRWIRKWGHKALPVTDCGAYGDDSHDDTTAWSDAISVCAALYTGGGQPCTVTAPTPAIAYKITSITFTDGVSYDGGATSAEIDCQTAAAGKCVTVSIGGIPGVSYNNLHFSSANSNANAYTALYIASSIGATNFQNLAIYTNSTSETCLELYESFEVHFTGLTYLRECNAGSIKGDYSAAVGNNLIVFDQLKIETDSGSLSAPPISVCNGNGWSLLSGHISISAANTYPDIDLGNCSLDSTAGDAPIAQFNVRNFQFEGNASAVEQVGAGTYTGTAAVWPHAITWGPGNYYTMAGNDAGTPQLTGDVLDWTKVQGGHIFSTQWPGSMTSGSQYYYKLDSNSDGITINDAAFNSTYINVSSTNTQITAGAGIEQGAWNGSNLNSSQINGTSSASSAASGIVGEILDNSVVSGAMSLMTATQTNIVSKVLTAGDWDCNGDIEFAEGTGASATVAISGINTTSATLPPRATTARNTQTINYPAAVNFDVPVGPTRISIASTTTVYLVGYSEFSGGTESAGGEVRCRRMY